MKFYTTFQNSFRTKKNQKRKVGIVSKKSVIIVCGVLGTLVLVNLVYSFVSFTYEEGPRNTSEVNEESLFFWIYVPIMVIAGFMLIPLIYEDVSSSFKWYLLTISGINTILFLILFIPIILSILTAIPFDLDIFIAFILFFYICSFGVPLALHMFVFITFLKKKTLKSKKFDSDKKYYPS